MEAMFLTVAMQRTAKSLGRLSGFQKATKPLLK